MEFRHPRDTPGFTVTGMERGTVLARNANTQQIVVSVDGDHYVVFELSVDQEVEEGHRLRGNLESDVCFAVENLTTGEMISVVPQGTHPSQEAARLAIGL